jgi:O-antigen/teichoic acid export membrane protein
MINRFIKDAVLYALPMFLAKSIGLILLPIYTRYLGPADFGFVEFVAAASTMLLLILPLEINQAVARFLPESMNINRQIVIISSALWFTITVFCIFSVIVFVFRYPLFELLNLPETKVDFIPLICLSFLITAVVNLIQLQLRFTNQSVSFICINSGVVLSNVALVLYFTKISTLGLEQYFQSQILSGLVGILIGLVFIFRKYGYLCMKINTKALGKLLSFSLPIVFSSIGVALIGVIDKLMIGSYLGLTELGQYGAAARIAAIVGLGFYVISTAMTPIVYREHKRAETKNLIATIFSVTMLLMSIFLFFIYFYSEEIIKLIAGPLFMEAGEYIFCLTISAIIFHSYIFFMGMDISKKTYLLGQINFISGILNLLFVLLLFPIYGVWGIIVAGLIANTIRLFGYMYFSQKHYPIYIENFASIKFWKN